MADSLLTTAAHLARDPEFRDKVLAAVMIQARKTLTSAGAAEDLVRAGYARQVLQTPLAYAESFAWAMAADDVIATAAQPDAAAITDQLLVQRVALAWDALIRPLGT